MMEMSGSGQSTVFIDRATECCDEEAIDQLREFGTSTFTQALVHPITYHIRCSFHMNCPLIIRLHKTQIKLMQDSYILGETMDDGLVLIMDCLELLKEQMKNDLSV